VAVQEQAVFEYAATVSTCAEAAESAGVSTSTVWRWGDRASGMVELTLKRYCKQYQERRQDGLKPKDRRSDKGKPRKIPPEMLQKAVEIRESEPARSTDQVIAMLDRLFPEQAGQVKRSTLYLVAFIDNATGFCVAAQFHASLDGGIVASCLKSALTEHGLPAAIYLDNGAQFVSEQIREACNWLGIRHWRARARYGEGKGQIERHWKTVQESLVIELNAMAQTLTLAQLNSALRAWIEEYYHKRPYSDLKTPPGDLWRQDPTQLPRVDAVTLEAAFLLRDERKVSKTALVSLEGVKYLVHDDLASETVQVRYHPRQRDRIQIWVDGRFVQYAEPYEVPANSPKRPNPEAKTVPRRKGGPNLVEMLVAEREQKLAQRLDSIRSAGRTTPDAARAFTESEFVTLLCSLLGRTLEPLETEWAMTTWRRCGGLERERATTALTRFAARQGVKMHLSYYLDAVERAHLQARKGGGYLA
jgi:transposase InsO family protein